VLLSKSQRGDNIVDVLIAMLVASSVLGLSLATMNRNLKISQQSKERTEASKLAQGQLEEVKRITDTIPNLASIPPRFCVTSDGDIKQITGGIPNLESDTWAIYPAECKSGELYHIAISTPEAREYKVYVRWDKLGGGKEQVVMVYRTAR